MRSATALCLLAVCGLAAATTPLVENVAKPALETAVQSVMQNVLTRINLHGQMANTLLTQAGQLRAVAIDTMSVLSKNAEDQLKNFESQWCTPGAFKPTTKVPATFTGQSYSLTFSAGACYFNETKWLEEGVKELNCTEPAITYTSEPANFSSSYKKGSSFTSKECQISKAFGEPVEVVLVTFDGQHGDNEVVDVESLTAKVTAEMQRVLGSVNTNVQEARQQLFSAGTTLLGAGAKPRA